MPVETGTPVSPRVSRSEGRRSVSGPPSSPTPSGPTMVRPSAEASARTATDAGQPIAAPAGDLRLKPTQLYRAPHVALVDFNGTVEDGGGRLRPGTVEALAAMNAQGGRAVVTTSMKPAGAQTYVAAHRLPMAAVFGGRFVRPNEGNKHYLPTLEKLGVDPRAAAKRVYSVGDSPTDISGDVPGMLFINSHGNTPGAAIQLIIAELDRQGGGDLPLGLERLLGTPVSVQPATVTLGPLSFRVALRRGGTPAQPFASPTIDQIQVRMSDDEVRDQFLKAEPDREDLEAHAVYQLARGFVARTMPVDRAQELVDSLADTPAQAEALALGRELTDRGAFGRFVTSVLSLFGRARI